MTEKRFALCQGKQAAVFEKDGWWRCGGCGRRLYPVGKTYEVDVNDEARRSGAAIVREFADDLRILAESEDNPDTHYSSWV